MIDLTSTGGWFLLIGGAVVVALIVLVALSRSDTTPLEWAEPGAIARHIARAATVLLPRYVRARYRQEFVAEMYGMSRSARARHAVGVLSRSWALRMAIRAPAGSSQLTAPTASARPLRCRLRWHRWRMRSTTDGARFRRCARCGKDKFDGASGGADWASPAGL